MISVETNIHIEKGTTWKHQLLITDEVTKKTVDLTAYTAKCQIREKAGADTIIASPTITLGADGILKLALTAADTATIYTVGNSFAQYSRYYYDVLLTHTVSGDIIKVVYGIAFVYPTITK